MTDPRQDSVDVAEVFVDEPPDTWNARYRLKRPIFLLVSRGNLRRAGNTYVAKQNRNRACCRGQRLEIIYRNY